MARVPDTRGGEEGSGPVLALIMIALVAVAFGVVLSVTLAQASGESDSAQHAADASALAGAKGVVAEVESSMSHGFASVDDIGALLGGGSCVQLGEVEAAQYAAANHAGLTSYCWNVPRDRIEVSVQMTSTDVQGPRAQAKAVSALGFDPSACFLSPSFEKPTPPAPSPPAPSPPAPTHPSPVPPSPPKPSPPAPPADISTWVDCGFGHLRVSFTPTDGLFHFDPVGQLEDALKPRLVE